MQTVQCPCTSSGGRYQEQDYQREYSPGQALPSLSPGSANLYNVKQVTIRNAIADLGWSRTFWKSHLRVGTFVQTPKISSKPEYIFKKKALQVFCHENNYQTPYPYAGHEPAEAQLVCHEKAGGLRLRDDVVYLKRLRHVNVSNLS